jgi:hypothetical protein
MSHHHDGGCFVNELLETLLKDFPHDLLSVGGTQGLFYVRECSLRNLELTISSSEDLTSYCWDQLHTGKWDLVDYIWRQVYSWAVLVCCCSKILLERERDDEDLLLLLDKGY